MNGKMLTGRNVAHKHIADMLAKGEKLPTDFTNRVTHYVGSINLVRDEVVSPTDPTTATYMDKFTEAILVQTGLIAVVGKAERGPVAIESIKKRKSTHLVAVGGVAYLAPKAIRGSKALTFEDLGTEVIYEFNMKDMPVTVMVDNSGTSIHKAGPAE